MLDNLESQDVALEELRREVATLRAWKEQIAATVEESEKRLTEAEVRLRRLEAQRSLRLSGEREHGGGIRR